MQKPENKEIIAFAGLGAMGRPMAGHLRGAGYHLRGFDPSPEAQKWLRDMGGEVATDPRAMAEGVEILILMVVNAAQVESVLFDQGALEAMAPGGIVVVMATCPPQEIERIATRVAASGRYLVDAPVSGGQKGAIAGELTIMLAGDTAAVERVKPVLTPFAGRVFVTGTRPGQGAATKAVNQLLCGVHIAAAAEALFLAEQMGLDPDVMLDIVTGSSAASWMLSDRGPRMIGRDDRITSAVDIFVKDLDIVLASGRGVKAPLPLSAAAHQLFLAASASGDGGTDDSQVIRSYRRMVAAAPLK